MAQDDTKKAAVQKILNEALKKVEVTELDDLDLAKVAGGVAAEDQDGLEINFSKCRCTTPQAE